MLVLSALALLLVPTGLFAVLSTVGSASTLLILFMTLVGSIVVMATALFTVVIPNELRGLCTSVAAAACVLFGTGLAPITVSVLSGALGGPQTLGKALTLVCVVVGIVCAIAFVLARRYFPGVDAQPGQHIENVA
jgi:hypothetical protein